VSSPLFKEIESILRQELKNDPEALDLAVEILVAYEKGGLKGVRRLLSRVVEQASSQFKGG